MNKFYQIQIPEKEMNGVQYVLATESRYGLWRNLLLSDYLTIHQLAGRIKEYTEAFDYEQKMPTESELGFALLRLVQEGLVGMTTNTRGPLIKFKRLHEKATIPKYAKDGDAGADVKSVEDVLIPAKGRRLVRLGFAIEIEPGWEVQVRPKSGLAANNGITVLNTPGTIDSGYRGECKVIMANLSSKDYKVEAGAKVAQFVVKRAPQAHFEEVDELSDSNRGTGGFGSTGV